MSYLKDMSEWTQVGENLVRHQGGTIYLRAKVKGKVIRVSLRTEDIRIAKIKRDERLQGIRNAAVNNPTAGTVKTLGDAVAAVRESIINQPHLKARTVEFYEDVLKVLIDTLPVTCHARSWSATEAGRWWKTIAKRFNPQRANNVLGVARRVGKALVELGVRADDPTTTLKRVRVIEKHREVPSRQTILEIIANIREQGKAHSEEAANYVSFLAFAGCRHGQAVALTWEDVGKDWVRFKSGISGTKGAGTRELPISAPLRSLLDAMRPADATGPLFKMKKPKNALTNACDRMKLPHLRIHDLRHFFATYALECGVDVPTVAKWLGHKDGGALVLKTYFHGRDDHSLASAKKLTLPASAPVIPASEDAILPA